MTTHEQKLKECAEEIRQEYSLEWFEAIPEDRRANYLPLFQRAEAERIQLAAIISKHFPAPVGVNQSSNHEDRLFDAEQALREIAIFCTGNDPSDSDDICANDIVGMVERKFNDMDAPKMAAEPGGDGVNHGLVEADEIIQELESDLQSASERECKCGTIESEFGCPHCSKYGAAIARATRSIKRLESIARHATAENQRLMESAKLVHQYLLDTDTGTIGNFEARHRLESALAATAPATMEVELAEALRCVT